MYRFTREVSSMATGKIYSAGMIVPEGLYPPYAIPAMLAAGDIELVVDAPAVSASAPVEVESISIETPTATVVKPVTKKATKKTKK